MQSILEPILHEYVHTFPGKNDKPEIALTVGTHDPNRDNSKFRMSDAGKCRLMRYYKRQGKPSTDFVPAPAMLQMQLGNMIHAYVEHVCKSMGVLIASEETLETSEMVGHFDLIIRTRDMDGGILYDLKTINSKAAYYMDRDGGSVKPEHAAQIVTYYTMIDAAYQGEESDLRSPDRLAIAYITRDTFEIKEFEVEFHKYSDQVYKDWEILFHAWKHQTPPEANPAAWECRYCAYHRSCEFARA